MKMVNLLLFEKIFLYYIFIGSIISIELYEQYDIRNHYKCESFNVFRDQKHCGGCWAFSVAETISDRICIDSGGKDQTLVSETELLTCLPKYRNSTLKGCGGASRAEGFHYWVTKGLPTKNCKPFPFGKDDIISDHSDKLECKAKCQKTSDKMVEDKGSFYRQIYGEENIMEEIQINGPVTAGFDVYEDFFIFWKNSRSEIYEHKNGNFIGYHSLKIIGWGSDIINGEKKKYWLCVNSWGEDDSQVFKFIRGIDDCKIESSVITGYKTSKILF